MGGRTAAEGSTPMLLGVYIEEAPSLVAGLVIPGAVVAGASAAGGGSRSVMSVSTLLVLDEGTDTGWKFR